MGSRRTSGHAPFCYDQRLPPDRQPRPIALSMLTKAALVRCTFSDHELALSRAAHEIDDCAALSAKPRTKVRSVRSEAAANLHVAHPGSTKDWAIIGLQLVSLRRTFVRISAETVR